MFGLIHHCHRLISALYFNNICSQEKCARTLVCMQIDFPLQWVLFSKSDCFMDCYQCAWYVAHYLSRTKEWLLFGIGVRWLFYTTDLYNFIWILVKWRVEKLAVSFCLYHVDNAKSQFSQTSATFRISKPPVFDCLTIFKIFFLKSFSLNSSYIKWMWNHTGSRSWLSWWHQRPLWNICQQLWVINLWQSFLLPDWLRQFPDKHWIG